MFAASWVFIIHITKTKNHWPRWSNLYACCFFRPGHDDLIQVLEEKYRKPNQRINAKLESQIKLQYKRKIQNETDMYKCAVYGVIGCCDVPDHSKVAKTTDDFLWIQLSMIQPDDNGNMSNLDDTIGSDCLTYSALQSMILEKYGEKHFNAIEQPHLYFQVRYFLLLTNRHSDQLFRLDIYFYFQTTRFWLWLGNLNRPLSFYHDSIATERTEFILRWLSMKCFCSDCHGIFNSRYVNFEHSIPIN